MALELGGAREQQSEHLPARISAFRASALACLSASSAKAFSLSASKRAFFACSALIRFSLLTSRSLKYNLFNK